MKQPNILLIYTDQQRYDSLGCCGNSIVKTPNLDRLALEGTLFHRSYVATPLCVPSRVSMFTGRHGYTTGSYNNGLLMAEQENDFVSLLRRNGYTTGLIGKDHCFGEGRLRETFDFYRDASHTRIEDALSPQAKRIRELRADLMFVPLSDDPVAAEENTTASLFRAACDYVKEQTDPFFLWLSIPDPHPPYMVSEPYASMYSGPVPTPASVEGEMDNKPYRQRLAVAWNACGRAYPGDAILDLKRTYWGMVTCIDDRVGKLMAALEASGKAEDTIVVFTSDHGDYLGDHGMIRKGPHLYEALTHVPLMVRWPRHVAVKETSALVSNIDVFPTILELAGVAVPFDGVEGESFADVLRRPEANKHRAFVCLEHGNPGNVIKEGDLAEEDYNRLRDNEHHHLCPEICQGEVRGVVSEHWKYCMTSGDVDELYDLRNDPNELVNVAAEPGHAGIVAQHRAYLTQWKETRQ